MAYKDEKGKPYSADYLRTIHAQLTAIFNHAVNFYNLPYNPARRAGTIGSETPREMEFWTKEEYLKFSEAMMDKPRSFYAFEMLYWCGIRSGELLALTPSDFDFEKQTVTISKTYHRSKGRDIVTSPKTKKSNHTIKMPPFLCEEMQEYIKMLYDVKPDERLFTVTKSYLNHEMECMTSVTRMSSPRQKNLQLFLRVSGQPHSCPELLNTVFMAHASFPDSLIPKKSCVTYSISIRSPGKI